MEIFIYLIVFSLASIYMGANILKSNSSEKIHTNKQTSDNCISYTSSEIFADIQIIFGKLILIPSICGLLFYELFGFEMIAIIAIIMCVYIVSSVIGIYKFYKNTEYKKRLSSKQINFVVILETILIIVIGINMFSIINQQTAIFKQVDMVEENGKKIISYELMDLPNDKSYTLEFNIKSYDIGDTNIKPKYEKHIGKSNVYYSQEQENPKVIFKIDEKDNCSIDVVGMNENKQKVKDNYKFQFNRVKNELSDVICESLEIPYNSKDGIIKKENNIGIYGSENNNESTSVRINIYSK